jgi:hypothetical protein
MADVSPIYIYMRRWFEFAFSNPDKVRPVHVAVYTWHIELNNRMGWVRNFGSPASQTMAACGISSYNTYKTAFNDLIEWGFIEMIKKSENQYQSNIIALSNFDKSSDRSLDNALSNFNKSSDRSLDTSLADHITDHLQHNSTYIPKEIKTDIPKDNAPSGAPLFNLDGDQNDGGKKKARKKSVPNKESSLYTQMVDVYFKWHNFHVGIDPIMKGANGKAMVDLEKYIRLQTQKKMEGASEKEIIERSVATWQLLLDALKSDAVEPFYRNQTKLNQIYSNLTNIVNQLKNGNGKNKQNAGRGAGQTDAQTIHDEFNSRFGNQKHAGG